MPFTPVTEADLAPLPSGFSNVTEADLAPEGGAAPAPAAPQTGIGESLARGAFQGVTFGFGDEISGLVRSLVNGTTYQQERDAARKANEDASKANPVAYGGAELVGGLAVPLPGGTERAAASVGAHALRGAIAGGIAGLGSSNADLLKGGFQQAASDTVQSALLGGAIGAVGGKIGQMVGKSGAKAEDQAIKALAGGESKTSGAAWQKTRPMVNNPETKAILREDVTFEAPNGKTKTTTLENVAGKSPDTIEAVVDAQTQKIGEELRPIYEKADAKNGGVSLRDYVNHLDDQIKLVKEGRAASEGVEAVKPMAPSEAKVYVNAIEEMKSNAIEQWGGGAKAMEMNPAEMSRNPEMNAAVRAAMAKQQLDVRIPSDEVRAEATALQRIGFKTVDPLNPGLQTQVKRDMGNMVRDFVNDHVMRTLGDEDHSRLLDLNKRMNAWLGVGTVAAARLEKEAAGRVSAGGHVSNLIGHGSLGGALYGLTTGHPVAAVGAYALGKLAQPEVRGAIARTATRTVAKVDRQLQAVAEAAKAGNPFAQKMIASIRSTPEGVARLAALERNGNNESSSNAPNPLQQ